MKTAVILKLIYSFNTKLIKILRTYVDLEKEDPRMSVIIQKTTDS